MVKNICVTRVDDTHFDVQIPVMMCDGRWRRDTWCHLVGNQLVSHCDGSHIRIGGLLCVTLGPARLAEVQALPVGASIGDTSWS